MNEKPEHAIEDDQQYLNDYRSEKYEERDEFEKAQGLAYILFSLSL